MDNQPANIPPLKGLRDDGKNQSNFNPQNSRGQSSRGRGQYRNSYGSSFRSYSNDRRQPPTNNNGSQHQNSSHNAFNNASRGTYSNANHNFERGRGNRDFSSIKCRKCQAFGHIEKFCTSQGVALTHVGPTQNGQNLFEQSNSNQNPFLASNSQQQNNQNLNYQGRTSRNSNRGRSRLY